MVRAHKGTSPRVHRTAFVADSAQVIGVEMGAILLPGVDVGEDSIVAAGYMAS